MDATRIIAAMLEMRRIPYEDPDEDYAERLMQVCRDMSHRAISVDTAETAIPFGATQYTTSVNGFSEQVGFQAASSSGYGTLYMTKAERSLIGINRTKFASIPPYPLGGRCCHEGC